MRSKMALIVPVHLGRVLAVAGFFVRKRRFLRCLSELEREFLTIGETHCSFLESKTQVTAFILLDVRAISLLRGLLILLNPFSLDAYDVLRRAFLETWYLQFALRFLSNQSQAQKWLHEDASSWQPKYSELNDFFLKRLGGDPKFGTEYGQLTTLAHPTLQSTKQSCAIATLR